MKCGHNIHMDNTEALATKTAAEAINRVTSLMEAGNTYTQARDITIREATEFHPACGKLVAYGFQKIEQAA